MTSEPEKRKPGTGILSFGKFMLFATSMIAFLFIALPPVVLVTYGIQDQSWNSVPESSAVMNAIILSFITTGISLIFTILFGTPLAYVLANYQFPGKRIANTFIELPIVMPPAVAGLALLLTLGRRGVLGEPLYELGITLVFTTAAVVLVQIFISAPFYIRSAQLAFSDISSELRDSARADGASEWTLFFQIIVPLTRKALLAGIILSWARAIGEFGATILFAGSLEGRTQTMPLLVYNAFVQDLSAAIWTGIILIVLAFLALLVTQWLTRNNEETY